MINLIWDLDGTLFNTYPFIVKRIQLALSSFKLSFSYEEIYEELIKTTTFDFLLKVEKEHDIKIGSLLNAIKRIDLDYSDVTLMPNIKKFFELNEKEKFCRNFIYTHRDHKTCRFLLYYLEMNKYFEEVVDESHVEFVRKPDTHSLEYLINKYNLSKDNTYYIGDRKIDSLCAKDAGIWSIFYNSSNVQVDYFEHDIEIQDVVELIRLIKEKKLYHESARI